jgi:hypothetical protein
VTPNIGAQLADDHRVVRLEVFGHEAFDRGLVVVQAARFLRPQQRIRPVLANVIDQLFSKSGGLTVKRLGFRYSNALNERVHGIAGVGDLDCLVEVAGCPIKTDVKS